MYWNGRLPIFTFTLYLTAAVVLFYGQTALSQVLTSNSNGCNSNDGSAPCFAQNDDILSGRRHLLRVDDLVVSFSMVDLSTTLFNVITSETSDLVPGLGVEKTLVRPSCTIAAPVPGPINSRLGRVFDLRNDVTITLAPSSTASGINCGASTSESVIYIRDHLDSAHDSELPILFHPPFSRLALADFDRDGYDDIMVIGTLGTTSDVVTSIYTADDLFLPENGLRFATDLVVPDSHLPRSEPVVADFNGDFALDVAWLGAADDGELMVKFVSICPSAGFTVLGEDCSKPFEVIASDKRSIPTGRFWAADSTGNFPALVLAAGDFDGAVSPATGAIESELAVVQIVESGANIGSVQVKAYGFDADLKATAGLDPLITGSGEFTGSANLYAASGRLDWFEPTEQLVIGASNSFDPGIPITVFSLWVVKFSKDLAMTADVTTEFSNQTGGTLVTLFGVAVGRFDPPDIAADEPDFNQQIAVLLNVEDSSIAASVIRTYTVDPPKDFTPKSAKRGIIFDGAEVIEENALRTAPLQVGDLQGRSLRLGPPEKATITGHFQPDTILGMPSMHVDFIEGLGGGQPSVLNVTVFPKSFNVGYDFADMTKNEASRKSTTSYTYSTKESADEKISYGIPDVASISVSAKQAATRTHTNTVARAYNTYAGQSFKFSTKTVFDDKVAATASRMNIYSYPVLGHDTCPLQSPGCPDICVPGPSPCPKLPLHVQFSGPDNVIHLELADGRALEWYQPVYQPGNLFTSPGSLSQLKADQPQQKSQQPNTPPTSRLQLLSPSDTVWDSQTAETVAVNWTEGGGADKSTETTNTHSFDSSVSVSGGVTFAGFGADVSGSYDYNKSNSASTLNSSTASFGESRGVTLNRGIDIDGPSSSESFLYEGESYIFGRLAPVGSIQTDVPLNADIQASGILTVGFAADPLSMGLVDSGDWWRQAYASAPDVALYHPQRWIQQLPTGVTNEQIKFNCPIGFTSTLIAPNCSPTSGSPNPLNLSNALFYQMKGLFVTPGDTAVGPASNIATAGDLLTLRARIYNNSLKKMTESTAVQVDFYAQPWDAVHGQFMSDPSDDTAFAPAVYIGRDSLDPIPAFCGGAVAKVDPCTDEDAPRNWVFAEVQWNTGDLTPTPLAETFWKFWVVVWMEDGGKLVSEVAEHGLIAAPTTTDLNSLADVAIETYSNNLGFYNLTFALFPPGTAPSASAAEATQTSQKDAEITIDSLGFAQSTLLREEVATLRAELGSDRQRVDHVLARFFEGDPEIDGQAFDQEIIPTIPAGSSVAIAVPYQPRSCGVHEIFVEAVPLSGDPAPAVDSVMIEVSIDAAASVAAFRKAVKTLDLPDRLKKRLAFNLFVAETRFKRGHDSAGEYVLGRFIERVIFNSSRRRISQPLAILLIARAEGIIDCV